MWMVSGEYRDGENYRDNLNVHSSIVKAFPVGYRFRELLPERVLFWCLKSL